MKPISCATFCTKYPVGMSDDTFVESLEKRFITNDLYVIQSTVKKRTYKSGPLVVYDMDSLDANGYVGRTSKEVAGPIQTYRFIPVYKLMSLQANQDHRDNNDYEKCLLAWNEHGLYSRKDNLIEAYAQELIATKKIGHSRKHCEFIIDAIYYKVNTIQMHYRDGRLKSGFKSHLSRRAKGFANNSYITNIMMRALQNSILNQADVNSSHQDDLFLMTAEECSEQMQEYMSPMYPAIACCPLTKQIKLGNHLEHVSLSGVRVRIARGLDLNEYGYTYDREHHTQLLEGEIMIDGSCYNSSTVEITNCNECNSRCVVEETRKGRCVDCLDMAYRIQNYSHRVEDTLGFAKENKRTDEPYLGIEIEYQVDKRKSGRLYTGDKLAGHALMKEDGSISNGFEIVSRPASYANHMLKYESFLDGLPTWIHPHKSCGMHVHISRTAFTQMGAGKLTEFMNREDNKKFITLIAGRSSTNYQRGSDEYDIKKPFQLSHDRGYAERYNYVNLNNKKTIELRMFASPNNTKEFKVRMQFVKAMIGYCRPAVLTGTLREQTSFASFVTWLDKSKKEFKELYTHIKESKICA